MEDSNYEPIVIFEKGKIVGHAGLIPEFIKFKKKIINSSGLQI